MRINFILLALLFFKTFHLSAQNNETVNPISVESFWGNRGALVEMTFHKPLKSQSKFGILSISEYYGTYNAKKQDDENQYMMQTHLTYNLFDNFDLVAGAITNNVDGLRPTAGFQYILPYKDFFFVAMPRIDLTQTHNAEILSLIEYTPSIHKKWSLYSRVEGLYNQDLKNNTHAISYLRLRLGTSYDIFRFGLGANFSSYGEDKFHENQFGAFIGALLF